MAKKEQDKKEHDKKEHDKRAPVSKSHDEKKYQDKSVAFTKTSDAVPAVVEEIVGRTGSRGEATQVICKILEGRDQNKRIRRNAKGPIRINDILMLRETEIEASRLKGRGRS